jgi:homoserine O-acetyltransferase
MVNISGAVHSLPFSIAIRAMQREAIQCDPHWRLGRYDETEYPERGMLMARKLGVITYRSAQEWDVRFGRAVSARPPERMAQPFGTGFAVEDYLDCQARRFARSFDPNSYLYLSRSMDWFDLGGPYGCNADDALAALRLEGALVIGVTTDILFPLHQQRQIADGLQAGGARVTYLPLDTPAGHDAFLVDTHRFGPPIAAFLASLPPCQPAGAGTRLMSTI